MPGQVTLGGVLRVVWTRKNQIFCRVDKWIKAGAFLRILSNFLAIIRAVTLPKGLLLQFFSGVSSCSPSLSSASVYPPESDSKLQFIDTFLQWLDYQWFFSHQEKEFQSLQDYDFERFQPK